MAYQKATVNGMVCVVDSATPTVPLRDVGGDLGDVIVESAFQLSRKRVAVASLDLMSANTGTALFPTASGCRGILNGSGDNVFVSGTNVAGFQASGKFYGAPATIGGHGSSISGETQGHGSMISSGKGSGCHGFANNYGMLKAYGDGSLAMGQGLDYGQIYSGVAGSLAMGYAHYAGAQIFTDGKGAIAAGVAHTQQIIASGTGSIAMGYASDFGGIAATGNGAVALGDTTGGAIQATAEAAVQLGPGTNAIANSIACGGTIRMKPDGTGTLRNGDFWYNTSTHKFQGRANGATIDLH